MATKIYGASDDLIEIEGDVRGEVGCYGTDDRGKGVLLLFSDGTILEAKYGKLDQGLWGITLHKQGTLFERIDSKLVEDDEGYSDIAHFKDGLTTAYAATEWELVK